MNNTQHALIQAFNAGFEAGQQMYELARIATEGPADGAGLDVLGRTIAPTSESASRRPHFAKAVVAATPATAAPKAPKATTIARGVKTAPRPRTKGVKSAIAGLITSGPMTVDGIIERTGFKKNSIVSTLMDLKKKGLAMQDGKAWISMGHAGEGNFETAYPNS